MQIVETLGVSKESILAKEHNLWIGISFGNKWFVKENIDELIRFGLEYTKESLLVWVPGRLHATNLRYFDDLSRAQSLKKAFDAGDEKIREIKEIKETLDEESQKKIIIVDYDEVLNPRSVKQKEVLMREFAEQGYFYSLVMEIAEEMLKLRGRSVSKDRAESVALYILQEFSLFLDGISKNDNDIVHTVVLYPGIGKFDELVMRILNEDEFKKLRGKLNIKNKTGIASVK